MDRRLGALHGEDLGFRTPCVHPRSLSERRSTHEQGAEASGVCGTFR